MKEQIVINLTKDNAKSIIMGGMFALKNTTLPIVENIKFTVINNSVQIVSTDLANQINISFPLSEETEPCEFCINFDEFKNALKSINDDLFSLHVNLNKHFVGIKHAHGTMKFSILDSTNFPNNENEEISTCFKVNSMDLISMLSTASKFVCLDPLRQQMCGVNLVTDYEIESGNTKLIINATDAQKLYQDATKLNDSLQDNLDVIISTKAIQALLPFTNNENEIELQFSKTKVKFVLDENVSISSRLIEGKYPNVQAVIPQNFEIKAVLSVKELSNAIRRLMNGCNKDTYVAKFDFSKEKGLIVTAEDIEYARKATENIECESDGDIIIGLNISYLQNILPAIYHTDKVEIHLISPRRAVVFKEDSNEYSNQNLTCLLMPVLLAD